MIVSKEGIPLIELTLPNNQTDAKVAKKLINKLKRVYRFKKNAIFIADAAYDEKNLYNFIVNQLKCQAFIPINPRNTQPEKTFGQKGMPLCEANLEMKSNGRFREAKRERIKFRCPLKTNKKIAQKYPQGCPVNHPRFFEGKQYGCTKYLDITNDARAKIPRDSTFFKETYKLRTEVERYFSRLDNREIEQTTHYKSKAIKNQMTIAFVMCGLFKFRCPLKTDKTIAQKYPQGCPVNHPRFFEGKQYGCTKYLDITNDARAKVPRDSLFFKETYKLRTEVERYFSRLGNREIEQTTHYEMKSIKNQMTLAHLSLSLVAYAAAILMKKPDKIRCFRTFAQQPLAIKKTA